MLHLTGFQLDQDSPAALPFPGLTREGPSRSGSTEGEGPEMDFDRSIEPVDTHRIMATLAELEDGLAELKAEAEEIDELLEPLNFSRFKAAWESDDDDGPWAA